MILNYLTYKVYGQEIKFIHKKYFLSLFVLILKLRNFLLGVQLLIGRWKAERKTNGTINIVDVLKRDKVIEGERITAWQLIRPGNNNVMSK
jgi:hypothetical protein